MENSTKTYEETLNEVQELITLIESGSISLEDAVSNYEKGIRMLSSLEKQLNGMKRKIAVIRQNDDGSLFETVSELAQNENV